MFLRLLSNGFRLFWGRIGGPEVPSTLGTLPELLRWPRLPRGWVTKVHLFTAALASDLNIHRFDVAHRRILVPCRALFQQLLALWISIVEMIVPGVVLAGGRSSRMGRPKALLPVGQSDTFLGRIALTLKRGGVDDVVVVTSTYTLAESLESALEKCIPTPRIVINDEPMLGQLSSLLAGLRAIDRPGVDAMLVTLVDVPLVSDRTVRRLLRSYYQTRATIVRPLHADGVVHGHPVIFDRSVFGELRQADLKMGAKSVIRMHQDEVLDVKVDDEGAFLDIDTPQEYQRIFGIPIP